MTEEIHKEPPEGFREHRTRSGFSQHNGPTYEKVEDGSVYRGFYVLGRHCNSLGIVHGGQLMSFADALLGMTVWHETRKTPLTVRMTTDFISIARPGQWVEGRGFVTKATHSVIFCGAEIYVGKRTIMTAQAIFKAMERHSK